MKATPPPSAAAPNHFTPPQKTVIPSEESSSAKRTMIRSRETLRCVTLNTVIRREVEGLCVFARTRRCSEVRNRVLYPLPDRRLRRRGEKATDCALGNISKRAPGLSYDYGIRVGR